jgi:hypothetical protein
VDITEVGSISRLVATFLMLYLSLGASRVSAQPVANASTLLTIEASAPATVPETNYLQMGSNSAGRAPDGHVLPVNSRYLMLDGKPWLPVMAEFHYTRYPERYWEEEILKMKAGGVQIVATCVFGSIMKKSRGILIGQGRAICTDLLSCVENTECTF